MQAGKMDTKVILERATGSQLATGRMSQTWAVLSRVWAEKLPIAGGERKSGDQVQADISYRLKVRRYEGLKPLDRVLLPVAFTKLNGTINASVTTVNVDDAAGLNGTRHVYAQADSELMLITAGQGGTAWTVTRGADGTTKATHADDAIVTLFEVLDIRNVQEPDRSCQVLQCTARAD